MRRKVIQIANSTQLVSLPRKWCQRLNLKKGDELEVTEKGNSIVITTEKHDTLKKAVVDMTKLGTYIERFFHAYYKAGYDEVSIKYSVPEQLDQIQRILGTTTIGYEIVDQRANTCIVKSVAESSDAEFEPMLRRTFLLLKSMLDSMVDATETEDFSQIGNIISLEVVNNKYTGFCRRVLNKGGYDPVKAPLLYCVVEELEKIADECKYLCQYLLESEGKIKSCKQIKKICKDIAGLYDGCYHLFYTFETKTAANLFLERKKIVADITPLFDDKKQSARILHHLLTMTQKIANIFSFELLLSIDKLST